MFPKKEDPTLILAEMLITGDSSQAILNQEARGQSRLVSSEVLPKDIRGATRETFEQMGIVFGEDADDLFVHVTLPDGWKKEATDHSMWSKLLDEKGRERASIFYKAAFYDRSAHMFPRKRFSVSSFVETDADGRIAEDGDGSHWSTYVTDCGKAITLMGTREREYGLRIVDEHEAKAIAWLKENYPDYQNPLAYWD